MCLKNETLAKMLYFTQEICKLISTWAYSCITRTKKKPTTASWTLAVRRLLFLFKTIGWKSGISSETREYRPETREYQPETGNIGRKSGISAVNPEHRPETGNISRKSGTSAGNWKYQP